jgi:DNA replication protein DnaC
VIDPDLARRAKDWGIPKRALRIALNGPMDTEAIHYAREFMTDFHGGTSSIMVLAGGVGVGKTIAAAWIMTQIPQPFGARRFRHISELATTGLYGGDDDKKERATLKSCKVLVLDDVGTEHLTDTFQTLLDGLMNARYEDDGATVLTTNLTSEQFLSRYGKRIYDRLRGRGQWYDIAHESLRGQTP